jgi:hypothetical protein
MKMDYKNKQTEIGQSVVLVTLMLLGLITMLALVLDGGNFYTQRRAAQVAADAGALAGAREYCVTENGVAAVNRAYEYAVTRNEADAATVTVDSATGDVTVDASITFDTFFLGILNRPQLVASASAVAACDPASSAFVLPIAWSCQPPNEGGGTTESEDCELFYWDTFDGIDDCDLDTGGGDYVYIVVDSEDIGEDVVCADPENPPEGDVLAVDCDFNDDGTNDVELLSAGSRSWLDIGGTGGSASDLIDWIENGLGEPIYPHTWFAGQRGATTSVYAAIHENALNQQVVIPVFNAICDGYPATNCADQMHAEDEIITASETADNDYFHVISFALFYPTCVQAGSYPRGGDCPVNELLDLPPQVKTVEGCFLEGVDPSLGSGGGEIDTGADVVYLKR